MRPRTLIVNADDLGYTPATNAGIFLAHREGVVTSASLMVDRPAAAEAVREADLIGFGDLGLHLDLGEWVWRSGSWEALYEIVDLRDTAAVVAECERQLARFLQLTGRNPTHVDSHQHVHLREPAMSAATSIAARLGVPLRHRCEAIRYEGGFYGQSGRGEPAPEHLTTARILGILEASPADTVELGCHPGLDPSLETMYCRERLREVEVLCCPDLRAGIRRLGFALGRFTDVASGGLPA